MTNLLGLPYNVKSIPRYFGDCVHPWATISD